MTEILIEMYKGWKIYPNYNENNEPEWFIVGSRGQMVDVEDRADAINYIDGVESDMSEATTLLNHYDAYLRR